MTRKTRRRNKSQGADLEAQPEDEGVHYNMSLCSPFTLLYEGARRKGAHEMSALTSGGESEVSGTAGSNALVGKADREGSSTPSQTQAQIDGPFNSGEDDEPGDNRTPTSDTAQPMPSDVPRMIGDFDDNANALWSLHMKEAMNHDEARIQYLKDADVRDSKRNLLQMLDPLLAGGQSIHLPGLQARVWRARAGCKRPGRGCNPRD
ncbi:hypothetical protein BJY52DRAFT_629553 [Lactarius psammicola]|nr:hypothetical protein BJY52DRAFT_629553 [Lactarius psammicola]